MCGIAGIVRNPSSGHSDEKVARTFKHMLALSQKRGSDSTGVVLVNEKTESTRWVGQKNTKVVKRGGVVVFKDHIPAEEFIRCDGFGKVMKRFDENTRALLGHTRAATTGTPSNNRNNHPHICGRVIGIHNGMIRNWRELIKEFELPMQGKCDSEVIFALINKFMGCGKSLQEAISEAAKHLKGSYACAVALSDDNGKFALFRHRAPLYMRYRSYGSALMFASEVGIIHQAYRAGKWEPKHSPFFVEMHEYVLPDNYGVVLKTAGTTTAWLQETAPFQLSS